MSQLRYVASKKTEMDGAIGVFVHGVGIRPGKKR
jgi:hypothetical protein